MTLLHHRPQRLSYGCLYHALFALTGDEAWLEHVEDVSVPRWHARLHAAGLMVMNYWNGELLEQPCPTEIWTLIHGRLAACPGEHTHTPLLVTVKGPQFGLHIVGIALPAKDDCPVFISDSARDSVQEMSLAEFLESPWAAAYAVEGLILTDVDAYPEDPGHRYFSEPSAEYAM